MRFRKILYIVPCFILAAYFLAFYGSPYIYVRYIYLAYIFFTTLVLIKSVIMAIALIKAVIAGRNGGLKFKAVRLFIYCAAFFTLLFYLNRAIFNPRISSDKTSDLMSLPYLNWSIAGKIPDKEGITVYNKNLASGGLNLFYKYDACEAWLIDMDSRVLHKWRISEEKAYWFHHVELCENGDLLVIRGNQELRRIGWDSGIKWKRKTRAHHDIGIAGNGDIYVLVNKDEIIFRHGIPVPVLGEYIEILSPDGALKDKICLTGILKNRVSLYAIMSLYSSFLKKDNVNKPFRFHPPLFMMDSAYDIFHCNSIDIIDKDIKGLCKKGDLLLSAREQNLIFILDPAKKKIEWEFGPGILDKQHMPRMLDNGDILIFDNGTSRKYSRVIEIEPFSKNIVWEYPRDKDADFYSTKMGASQRLPNGNTLITDSYKGRAFEVTKSGETVWEYYNPYFDKNKCGRLVIYRMTRYFSQADSF